METVIQLAESVRRGERKATELLDDCLSRIEARNPALNAFVHVDPDLARQEAERVDQAVARGDDPGPLAGVPFGVKDLEDCAGMPTSQGSLLYKGLPPAERDSIHVARLRAAGAVPVGKTAAPEFGTVSFTRTLAWGTTRNPWNPERTPGGSSGGSAAAVAAAMVPFCTASDGGGSTRIPGAFSGLPGFKPSYGRIPHPGGMSQTSVYGVLATTVADTARHLDVTAGPDDRDRTSLPASGVSYERAIEEVDLRGKRAMWSVDLGQFVVDPEVAGLCEAAAYTLAEAAGLELVDVPFRSADPLRLWLRSGALDLWDDLEEGHWPDRKDEVTPLVRLGLETTEGYTPWKIVKGARYRLAFETAVAALFEEIDFLITPTTAVPAFAAEGPLPTVIAGQDVMPGHANPFTMLANLCWNPAVSVPAGLNSEGLPVGLQVVGRRHTDDQVLRAARLFEEARPWPRYAPMAGEPS